VDRTRDLPAPQGRHFRRWRGGAAADEQRTRNVLADIRKSLGRSGPRADAIEPLPGSGPRPAFEGDAVERFVAKMLEKSTTLVRIASLDAVGPEVERFLASIGAGPRLCVSKALHGIAWPSTLEIEYRAAVRADQSCVTPCFAAVAESGGIVTLSGPDTPSTLNFVPDNHVVIVHAAQVLRHLEDVALWRRTRDPAHHQRHLGPLAHGRHRADDPARRARAAPLAHPARRGLTRLREGAACTSLPTISCSACCARSFRALG
jgi:L-lactate dehydrogenase complex protein LldG